ncbi:MAG: hypothetical protein JWM11_4773 [Planctomycetaceae bacterium]|nr:hypothetical protein [Planctomycetaceae bacterium]
MRCLLTLRHHRPPVGGSLTGQLNQIPCKMQLNVWSGFSLCRRDGALNHQKGVGSWRQRGKPDVRVEKFSVSFLLADQSAFH